MQLQNISKRGLWGNIIDVIISEGRFWEVLLLSEKLGMVTIFQAKQQGEVFPLGNH